MQPNTSHLESGDSLHERLARGGKMTSISAGNLHQLHVRRGELGLDERDSEFL
ncbi:uncharacterized protein G2W53_030948 [Senna tora]|uniref:Uncharacterized protein n=1 Tax=Senna tora TaxID=362788 RepID=A0A834WH90_9FABA|nr:uncharacterized protein G2W53_030948 [Senna tora]